MPQARVIAAHRKPDRPSIRVARGERVRLGERDTDWPQFVWTVLASGLGGWIPADVFDTAHGDARAQHDYDTQELDADPGDGLRLHREHAGWWWAEHSDGTQGWIPARVLQIDEDTR